MLSWTLLKLIGSEMLQSYLKHSVQNNILKNEFGKGQLKPPRILRDLFISYSGSVTENIHHTLASCPLSGYRIDNPEARIVKVLLHSKIPVFSLSCFQRFHFILC